MPCKLQARRCVTSIVLVAICMASALMRWKLAESGELNRRAPEKEPGPSATAAADADTTIALWLFDEPQYPGMTLTDASRHQFDLRLKGSGRLVPGRFGNAVQLSSQAGVEIEYACPTDGLYRDPMPQFLESDVVPEQFNLGYLDWTVEFWFNGAMAPAERGVVFEVSSVPTEHIADLPNTLLLDAGGSQFVLRCAGHQVVTKSGDVDKAGGIIKADQPVISALEIPIPTDKEAISGAEPGWHHLAFTFSARERQLRHFVDGRLQPLPAKGGFLPMKGRLKSLTIGRDRKGGQPLVAAIDEMLFSSVVRYTADFVRPGTFSRNFGPHAPAAAAPNGPPLLFMGGTATGPVAMGSRKHVFLDDVLLAEQQGLRLATNPPRIEVTDFRIDRPWEPAPRFGPGMPDILSIDDDGGAFRMAYGNGGFWGGKPSAICVATSKDGLAWEKPNVGLIPWNGSTNNNIVLSDATQGTMFRDPNPNAPADERYKYVGWLMQRGIYVWTSPDGLRWRRNETIALPIDCGGGIETFWDDQRGLYCTFIRHEGSWTDLGLGPGRACGLAQTRDLLRPWPFQPREKPGIRRGIFTLPSLTTELPVPIGPNQLGQVYRSAAVKYPGAPDAYLAFPWRYDAEQNRRPGSELMVSRDGETWHGRGEPFYFAPDFKIEERPVIEALMHVGIGVRGDEVVQFATARFTAHGGAAYGGTEYEGGVHDRLVRLTQRLDGFVSLDAAEAAGTATTVPLIFDGDHLVLNVAAKGAVRVGLLTEDGKPISSLSVEDCDPIIGDAVRHVVTWRKRSELGELSGKVVRIKLEMTNAKLYAIQFVRSE